MLLLLLACGPSPYSVELRVELEALDPQVPLEQALSGCIELAEVDRAGRCAVDALGVREAFSGPSCARLSPSSWRDECFFAAAEELAADTEDGDPAAIYALCDQAGMFAPECRFHTWSRPLMELVRASPDDPLLVDRARAALQVHGPLIAASGEEEVESGWWLVFWRTWWSMRSTTELSACDSLATEADRQACRAWSHDAQVELADHRRRNLPPQVRRGEELKRTPRSRGPR